MCKCILRPENIHVYVSEALVRAYKLHFLSVHLKVLPPPPPPNTKRLATLLLDDLLNLWMRSLQEWLEERGADYQGGELLQYRAKDRVVALHDRYVCLWHCLFLDRYINLRAHPNHFAVLYRGVIGTQPCEEALRCLSEPRNLKFRGQDAREATEQSGRCVRESTSGNNRS